jgi:LPS sulfotransferase NodH
VSNRSKSTSFVIFATQRTGSSWLMDMLDSHPTIASYDELLLAGASGSGYWGRTDLEFFEPYYLRHRKHDNPMARALWAFRYLRKLYTPRKGTEAIGMKLMYDQLWKNPFVWIYMIRHRVRVVHLVRANLLDIVLSGQAIAVRKTPHARQGDVVQTPAIALDPIITLAMLKTLERRIRLARRLLARLPIQHCEISYEQLLADPSQVSEVFAFLNVAAQPEPGAVVSNFKKLNTVNRSDLIENDAEIAQILEGTRFEGMLGG